MCVCWGSGSRDKITAFGAWLSPVEHLTGG